MGRDVGSSMEVPDTIRVAGILEKYHIIRNRLGIDTNVVVAAQYLSTSSQKLDRNTLFPTLRSLIRAETALRVCIVGEDIQSSSSPAYAPCHVDDSVLERLTRFEDKVRWDNGDFSDMLRLIEEELAIGYDVSDKTLPLWRLVVCQDNVVLFIYHHAIGDGKSGAAFHAKLLDSLNSTASTTDTSLPAPSLRYTLSPPVEECVRLTPSLGLIMTELFHLFAPVSWTNLHSSWTGNPVAPIPRKTSPGGDGKKKRIEPLGIKVHVCSELIELSPEDMQTFLSICRRNGATVTSALYILSLAVLSRTIISDVNTSQKQRSPYTTLSTLVPISMRPLSGIPEIAFTDHVSTTHAYPKLQPTFHWEAAREHAVALKKAAKNGGHASQQIGMLKFLFGRYDLYFKGQLGKKRDAGLNITNLGRFPDCGETTKEGAERKGWKIGRTLFNQSDVVVGAAFNLNVVGHATGGLSICMGWGPEALDAGLARRIVKEMKEGLKRIIRGEAP